MPKPLRYAEVYAGLQDGTVEEREHGGLYSFTPRMGRTSVALPPTLTVREGRES